MQDGEKLQGVECHVLNSYEMNSYFERLGGDEKLNEKQLEVLVRRASQSPGFKVQVSIDRKIVCCEKYGNYGNVKRKGCKILRESCIYQRDLQELREYAENKASRAEAVSE